MHKIVKKLLGNKSIRDYVHYEDFFMKLGLYVAFPNKGMRKIRFPF